MNLYRRFVLIIVSIFLVFSIFFIAAKPILAEWNIDTTILLSGNLLLFIVTIGIFSFQRKALQHSNPNVFIRSMMAGSMIKMLVCAVAVLVYVLAGKEHFNKIVVFIFLGQYIIYMVTEVSAIMKLNKQSNG